MSNNGHAGALRMIEGTGELVCSACEQKDEVIRLLEADLRGKRSQLSRLKGERNRRRDMSPFAPQIQTVWERWQRKCSPSSRELDNDFFDACDDRFKAGMELEEAEEAVDGMAARPYVIPNEGRSATGTPDQRNVNPEVIFRSERNVERFRSYAHEKPPEAVTEAVVPSHLAWLLEPCVCGHERMAHSKADPNRGGTQPCLTCDCCDFDDTDARIEEFIRQERVARPEGVGGTLASEKEPVESAA